MSTTTATFGIEAPDRDVAHRRKGLLQRLMHLRHRHEQARAIAAFEQLPDAMLADLGFAPTESRQGHAMGGGATDYWG